MKNKLVIVTILFALMIISVTTVVYYLNQPANPSDIRSGQIIALNEIEKLMDQEDERAKEKISELEQDIRTTEVKDKNIDSLWMLCGINLLFLILIFGYIWFSVLRPFDKMKQFAGEVAKGNFDVPLEYERSNYFGDFTWAFDSMRKEITKARLNEKEAIENNKTVIATLSHDIKTPISSIRAYAEGLEANLDTTPEKRAKYLKILIRKCDEVTKLTNDLFLHALSDLDKLKINTEQFKICSFMKKAISEIGAEQNDVNFLIPDFEAVISADSNRLMQITENLINNARKYAKSQIDIWIAKNDGDIELHFRDYGSGIPNEDLPFIFTQFYRGKNCGEEPGSGLGLYIVKYLTEKMNGKVLLHNHHDGLEAVVILPHVVS
ncbi:MAG: HAMP domain-containing histidine kinase [Lachnospiraceae bacterium]|nr:HAMP domain-containing histidine kinase [Lachnospiraceae bacterium]